MGVVELEGGNRAESGGKGVGRGVEMARGISFVSFTFLSIFFPLFSTVGNDEAPENMDKN